MSAGKASLKVGSEVCATLLALALIVTVACKPDAARAGCLPPASVIGRAAPLALAVQSPQRTNVRTLPLGGNEPIFGLWQLTATSATGVDHVITGWTGDGLEFDQDTSPILTGYICYGTYVKLDTGTYGLTHPFFNFQDVNSNGEGSEATEGQWDGTSGFFNYTISVSKDGKTFSGNENAKVVKGPDPYDPNATVLFEGTVATLSATKVSVDVAQLPQP